MSDRASDKSWGGNFFEDFHVGDEIDHATPRTVTGGDAALYTALYGSRFALHCSDEFARACGFERAPLDDLLVFHVVFGKTVPDISLNAVANLGYADCLFHNPVYPGDTLGATSRVIGVRQNSNGKTGTVYVRTSGRNQRGETVVEFIRWVMVNKRNESSPAPEPVVPDLPETATPGAAAHRLSHYDTALAGSPHLWDDYQPGERIDHPGGVTMEEAEHMMATRLYHNTATVHFDGLAAQASRHGRRIVYGGHVISHARALSFNGLANAMTIAAINGGRHVAPMFAGDTLYAWSEVLEKFPLAGRDDLGLLRLRTVAAKDHPCADYPYKAADGGYHPAVVLEWDYTILMPRQPPGRDGI